MLERFTPIPTFPPQGGRSHFPSPFDGGGRGWGWGVIVVGRMVLLVLMLALAPAAWAKEAAPAAEDPVLEREVMTIASELRCLVCQNQTLADSNAPLAVDLRNQIRDQLKQGRSAREIMGYMVERYGDFVLFRPPMKITTLLLWFGPPLLLIIGLVVLFRKLARRRVAPAVLSEAEHQAAARLLAGSDVTKLDNR